MQSNEDVVVDIIFVGDPVEQNPRDWEESFGHSCWFNETLPKQFSNTRSLCYRYHNQSSRDSSVGSVNHAAHDLLSEWTKLEINSPARPSTDLFEDARDQSNSLSRPVLFVCQSFGGPVVEEALLLSESKEELHALSRRTFGIIFLGSPHADSKLDAISSQLETPDRTHSYSQTRQIADIDKQSAHFTGGRMPDHPYIRVYFCQESSTPCPGARVLHHPCLWSMIPQFWLSESAQRHYVIPKKLPQDITRVNIARSIRLLSEEAVRFQDDRRRCLQGEQSLLYMHLRERLATSCEWLINLPVYQKWMNAAESPLLWLKGRPGAGKSILVSAIVKDLQERQEQGSAIAFCFVDFRQSHVSSARYVLKAFAYQLRKCMLPIGLGRMLHSIIKEGETPTEPLSLEKFQRKLRAVFLSVNINARIFLVLDGLDDDEGLKKVIMHEILRANRSREDSHIFRCVMSGRVACEARISPEDIIQVDLDTELGVQQDMVKYARTRLATILGSSPKQLVPISALAKQLCSRAKGNFLWLALAIEDISRIECRQNMAQTINSLPDSVEAFYQSALQKIPSQDVERAQKVFSWLTVASRLLYLPEVLEALVVQTDNAQLPEKPPSSGKPLSHSDPQAEIQRICGWLVIITTEGVVRLRHPTLRDYLFTVETSDRPHDPVLAAHELLARTCLVLLTSIVQMGESAQQLGRGMTSTLTNYATANWLVHYRLSETYSRILAGTLWRCLNITLDYDCRYFSIPSSGRSIQIANTILRISASYGLVTLTRICVQMGTDPKGSSCSICYKPLAIAAGSGHLKAANIILQRTVYPMSRTSYNADELIRLAVDRGLIDVATSLLECGTKVDAVEQISGKTLLHVASESGRLHMVKLLMGYNANVNAVMPATQETPLHLAAAHGHMHIVKYLIDGRDPSMRELELYDSIVQQPYYQSWTEDLLTNEETTESIVWEVEARDTAEELIGELRSCSVRYSNIELHTSLGRTALDLAAANGYTDVVRFLIERGASLKAQGDTRCTALQSAVENGHLEIVKLLLTAGATMPQQPNGLAPTLQHACKKGHDAVADLVLWHCFNMEFSAKQLPWPVQCLPAKTTNTVVRDAIRKKLHTRFSKLGAHTPFVQRLSKLADRPKD